MQFKVRRGNDSECGLSSVCPGVLAAGCEGGLRHRSPGQLPHICRDAIRITFVSNSFKSSCIALSLHQQVVPPFIMDTLLESNLASILGGAPIPLLGPSGLGHSPLSPRASAFCRPDTTGPLLSVP